MVARAVSLAVVATIVVAGCASPTYDMPHWGDLDEAEPVARDLHVAFELAVAKPVAEPFSGVVFDHTVMTIAGAAVAVSGTVDVRSHALDLVARVGDLVATVRGTGARARACVTGHVADATLTACGVVPASLAALKQLRGLDVTWQLAAPDWRGHGTGTLAWRDGELVLDRGHAGLVAISGQLAGATIAAELHGALTHLAVDVTGEARTAALALRDGSVATTLHDLALPFALHVSAPDGVVAVRAITPLVARGTEAMLELGPTAIAVRRPVIALATAGELLAWPHRLDWTADEATWHDVTVASPSGTIDTTNTLAWTAITGIGPLDGGAGALAFTAAGERVRVTSGWIGIAGGIATVEPFVTTGAPHDVVVHLDNVELEPLLAVVGRGRIEGTGLLDGRLVVRVDGAATTIVGGTLRAHSIGSIRVADAAWRTKTTSAAGGLALDKRIAAALGDFEYAGLDANLGTHGHELQINVHGQGKHIPQELDLVLNLNGIRETLARSIR